MESYLDTIVTLLMNLLPSDWQKVVLHLGLNNNAFAMYFFVRVIGKAEFYSYYDLEQFNLFSENDYQETALKIGTESLHYHKSKKEKWTGFTLTVTCDGQFKIDYEFDEQPLIIEEKWIMAYLK